MEALLVAVFILAGLGMAYVMYRSMHGPSVRRAFSKHPVTQIFEITEPGLFRVSGKAVAIGEAPISEASDREYLARDLRIVEGGTGDSASTRPAKQAVDFLLDDGTGRVLVRANDAVVGIDRDYEMPKTTLNKVPWVDELLRAGGYHNGSPSTCTIRVYEGVLEPADAEARQLGAKHVVRGEGRAPVAVRVEGVEGVETTV